MERSAAGTSGVMGGQLGAEAADTELVDFVALDEVLRASCFFALFALGGMVRTCGKIFADGPLQASNAYSGGPVVPG